MFKNLVKEKREKGFTIIEVLIVLAIAGLIMVIVLIAVPQLQRNQRNESRRSDAARIGTSVSNWSANNEGQILVAGVGNANLTAVLNDLGNQGQYILAAGSSFTVSDTSNLAAIGNLTDVRIVTGAKCGASGAAQAGTPRQFTVLYATETNSGGAQGQCIAI